MNYLLPLQTETEKNRLELNEVLVEGAENTVSMMAQERQVLCLTGGSAHVRSHLLLAMLGLVTVKSGFVNLDGEPLERQTVKRLRKMMAYAPSELKPEGQVTVYEPPSVQDLFNLEDNREAAISNGLLTEEMKRTGAPHEKAQLLAMAVLRQRPILLVENPAPESADYLKRLAREGRTIIVTSDEKAILDMADVIIEI